MVGPPKVISKRVDDKLLEPYEVNFLLDRLSSEDEHIHHYLCIINLSFF